MGQLCVVYEKHAIKIKADRMGKYIPLKTLSIRKLLWSKYGMLKGIFNKRYVGPLKTIKHC